MSVLIPTGFRRIVCSDLRGATSEVFWNETRRLLLVKLTVGEKESLLGPFDNGGALEAVVHSLRDVQEMKGVYGAC